MKLKNKINQDKDKEKKIAIKRIRSNMIYVKKLEDEIEKQFKFYKLFQIK